jgi:hypothetical protein
MRNGQQRKLQTAPSNTQQVRAPQASDLFARDIGGSELNTAVRMHARARARKARTQPTLQRIAHARVLCGQKHARTRTHSNTHTRTGRTAASWPTAAVRDGLARIAVGAAYQGRYDRTHSPNAS